MSGFSLDWLRLRADADDRARAPGLLARAVAFGAGQPLLVADLGGGAGATRRALGPHLPRARWRVLDHDRALLSAIPPGPDLEAVEADLAARPEAAFEGGPGLIAASAFFDLVSAEWIGRFADLLAAARLPLYAALTYDGRETWEPAPPGEAEALVAFHADMGRDKGFGSALGPAAPDALAAALRARGYRVEEAASDWVLEAGRDDALIAALAEGGAAALGPAAPAGWAAGRAAARAVRIGHRDLWAEPV